MRSKNGLAAIVLAVLVLAVALLPAARADQEQAMTYFNAGKYLEAAGEFQALVDEHPDYAFAYFMLGNCFLKTDEVGDAEKNLLKAIELNGEDFRYHYQLANTYAKMGKRQEVVGTLNNAEALVAENPQSKQALLKLRGQASYSMKDWQAAIDDLSQVEQDADTSMRLAKASFQIGDPKAPQRLADAAKANPKDASIRELQAEALLDLAATAKSDTDKKDWADSFGWFDNATRCDPNMAMAWEYKAYTLQKQGKFAGAVSSPPEIKATVEDYLSDSSYLANSCSLRCAVGWTVNASSSAVDHVAMMLNDDNVETAWVAADGGGEDEFITFHFPSHVFGDYDQVRFDGFQIISGFAKSDALYRKFARPKTLLISWNGEPVAEVHLQDKRLDQAFKFDAVDLKPGDMVQVMITEAFRGEGGMGVAITALVPTGAH